jgi:hypothetical protein
MKFWGVIGGGRGVGRAWGAEFEEANPDRGGILSLSEYGNCFAGL